MSKLSFDLNERVKSLPAKLCLSKNSQPERQPEGFVFVEQDKRKILLILISIFAVFFIILIGLPLFIGVISYRSTLLSIPYEIFKEILNHTGEILNHTGFELIIYLCILMICWIILYSCLIGVINLISTLRSLGRADFGKLVFPSYPLRLGETMTITFRRPLKPGFQGKVQGKILGRLICLEVYEDSRGSSPATYNSAVIWSEDLPQLLVPPNTLKIEQTWRIPIPSDCPPTINISGKTSESHNVLWAIDVLLDIPGVILDDSVFCFLVEPEVV